MSGESPPTPGRDALQAVFGGRSSSYLVLPRTLLLEMPDEWQGRFAACIAELDRTFHKPQSLPGSAYVVRFRDGEGNYLRDPLVNHHTPDRAFIESLRVPPAPIGDHR
jgi:hypothetical protein